ncbi:hypothetical protein G6F56_013809 [Rhizopus delemar]|nr:hypothetical protein G6F56_013809 [Rhizopus delemar]
MTRVRGRSFSQAVDEELVTLDKQFEFIITEFKHNVQDVDSIIHVLRARLAAEDTYITALQKVKKTTSIYDDKASTRESQLTLQQAIKIYEASCH